MKQHFLTTILVLLVAFSITAQETFPQNGVFDQRDGHYAFTNAIIFPSAGQKLENATLIIKKGRIEAVGTNLAIPEDAVVIPVDGQYIYPSFIDPFASYGLPDPQPIAKGNGSPQMLSNKEGAYSWNEALRSEFDAYKAFVVDAKAAKEWREQGFGAVMSHQENGISRGSGCVVLTGEDAAHEMLLSEKAAHILSFSKGKSTQDYPSSLMGCTRA